MTSRQRVIAALSHEPGDRVPVDIGATPVSGISASALTQLRQALGYASGPVRVHEPFQLLGQIEEEDRRRLNIDVLGLFSPGTMFGYPNKDWKPWTLMDGTPVLVGGGFETSEGGDGYVYIYPQGDRSAKPSGRIPVGGYFFDAIVRQEPYDEENLNARADFKEQFPVFSQEDLRYLEENARRIGQTPYAGIGIFGGGAFGDVALLPAAGLKRTPGIRGVEDWYMAHLLSPQYVHDVFDMQLEAALQNLELYKQAVGDAIQVIYMSGTDFGTQRGQFISNDVFREFYKPRLARVNEWVHQNTNWKTFFHSCGGIAGLIPDMIESGMDILNPVQCSAEGMDARALKAAYGDKIVFWGGGVDTQRTLPFGTPEEVYAEVRERLEIFSQGGGFVFNTVHNIQAKTPVENLLAMLRAIEDFNAR